MGSTRSQKDEHTSRGATSPPLRHSPAVKPSNPGVPRSDSFLMALPLWWPFSQVSGIWLVYRTRTIFHPDGTLCAPTQASLPKTHDSYFGIPVPDGLDSAVAAPMLCAGITVYSPLRRYLRPASRVGIVGIGGLGHLAIQFARAMGTEVTAISTTRIKPLKRDNSARIILWLLPIPNR